jgi:hypothetical protein
MAAGVEFVSLSATVATMAAQGRQASKTVGERVG